MSAERSAAFVIVTKNAPHGLTGQRRKKNSIEAKSKKLQKKLRQHAYHQLTRSFFKRCRTRFFYWLQMWGVFFCIFFFHPCVDTKCVRFFFPFFSRLEVVWIDTGCLDRVRFLLYLVFCYCLTFDFNGVGFSHFFFRFRLN